jgi:hypothetical protein
MSLRPTRIALVESTLLMGLFAIAQTLLILLVFDWDVRDVLASATFGTAVFGVADWLFETHHGVPEVDEQVPDAPAEATIANGRDTRVIWRWLILPAAAIPLAWVASEFDAGAFAIPGQTLGYMAANLFGWISVARWERREGRRLLMTSEGREVVLYAR